MSWNKNTVNLSSVDAEIKVLQNLGEPFELKILDYAVGNGLNDLDNYPSFTKYLIRRLAYKNIVILEQMHRAEDCDMDDYILSFEFPAISEPTEWPTEVNEVVEFPEIETSDVDRMFQELRQEVRQEIANKFVEK